MITIEKAKERRMISMGAAIIAGLAGNYMLYNGSYGWAILDFILMCINMKSYLNYDTAIHYLKLIEHGKQMMAQEAREE